MGSKRIWRGVLALYAALAFLPVALAQVPAPAPAAPPARNLSVATRVVPPFVMKKDGEFVGFSVDLWRALASAIGAQSNFAEVATLPELLAAVGDRKADVAISAISITSEREQKFDFSQPMFDAGMQIMVRSDGAASGLQSSVLWQMFSSGPFLDMMLLLALFILVPALVVWYFERKHPNSIMPKGFARGILHSIWWSTGAAGAQQLDYPRSGVGRFVSGLYIFISVVFVAYFTAAVTSAMTIQQLKGEISGPEDLPGKKVATVAGSTSAAFLKQKSIAFLEYPGVDQAIQSLTLRNVDAVVFDAPVLLYHASHDGKGKVAVVGQIFRREAYGLLFPPGSALRKPVNEALLKLRENGVYDGLYRKWFVSEGATP